MSIKHFTCIVCPKGCHIQVDENGNISGYTCLRGLNYVKQELVDPRRCLTSTFKVNGSKCSVCPCKSSENLPKDIIKDVIEDIDKITVDAPIKMHQVIIENVRGLGVDIIATREIAKDGE